MNIVPFCAAHVTALAEIERLCFSSPWSEEALAEELSNPCARFFVAEEDGQAIGYIGCLFVADEGDITNVAVHPAHRRRGIAARLLDALLDAAADERIEAIHLEVRASNVPAIALYESRGFRPDGVRPRFYTRPTEDAVLYTLKTERE